MLDTNTRDDTKDVYLYPTSLSPPSCCSRPSIAPSDHTPSFHPDLVAIRFSLQQRLRLPPLPPLHLLPSARISPRSGRSGRSRVVIGVFPLHDPSDVRSLFFPDLSGPGGVHLGRVGIVVVLVVANRCLDCGRVGGWRRGGLSGGFMTGAVIVITPVTMHMRPSFPLPFPLSLPIRSPPRSILLTLAISLASTLLPPSPWAR